MTKTVSAKVPDELKEELEREGINVSEVIRDALSEELAERRRETLQNDVADLRERVGNSVSTETIVDSVRETREER
ncbi:ribbon-helix-helix protein, CopG family [Halalkalicoccus tibetensis]|uniref:Ribbon-helix-helix protein, CopG family n=1 Tax=Halalkalicoccus tibetensis TaxID=175632 RepID=A0ABD5VAC7_9EURY